MKFRNDSENDRHVLGISFAAGATVDVSTTDAEKLAYLARNFTVVEEVATVSGDGDNPMGEPPSTHSTDDEVTEPTGFHRPDDPPKRRTRRSKGEAD